MKTIKIFADSRGKTVEFALEELKKYLEVNGNHTLIGVDTPKKADMIIRLGIDGIDIPEEVESLFPKIKGDGFIYGSIIDGRYYIIGKTPRAVLFGVYHVLEEELGIVFAAPDHEYVPERFEFKFANSLQVSNPALEIRGLGVHGYLYNFDFTKLFDWMAKRKFNCMQTFCGHYEANRKNWLDELLKRDFILDIGAHSAFFFMPPGKYKNGHPEFYSRGGKANGEQLCYSSKEMLKVYSRHVIDYLKSRPEIKIIGLWPQDGGGFCECEECAKRYIGETVGAAVNRVAKIIENEAPGILVNHLAYFSYTKTPKDVHFADNVMVNFCDYWDRTFNKPLCNYRYGCVDLHDAEDVENYKSKFDCVFRDHKDICQELNEWIRAVKTPTAFSYYADLISKFYNLTDVSAAIRQDMEYFNAIGLKGYIDCCNRFNLLDATAINSFALGVFSWEPSFPFLTMRERFVKGYFGPDALGPMMAFYDELCQIQDRPTLLGFNFLDLLHRHPKESSYFAGVVNEKLVMVVRRKILGQIESLKDCLKETAHKMPAVNIKQLSGLVSAMALRFDFSFQIYLIYSYIRQGEEPKADAALAQAEKCLNNFNDFLKTGNIYGEVAGKNLGEGVMKVMRDMYYEEARETVKKTNKFYKSGKV